MFRAADPGMRTFRIEVGYEHGVKPGNIVGAIANEANLDSKNIGRIDIYEDYSVLDLPENLAADVLEQLKTVRVAGRPLQISRDGAGAAPEATKAPSKAPVAKVSMEDAVARSMQEVVAAPADASAKPKKVKAAHKAGTYRVEVGRQHAVTPSQIVGAIANEANLDAKLIGQISIFDNYSLVELPDGMPAEVLSHLQRVWVAGQTLRISRSDETAPESAKPAPRKTLSVRPDAGNTSPFKSKRNSTAGGNKPLRKPKP